MQNLEDYWSFHSEKTAAPASDSLSKFKSMCCSHVFTVATRASEVVLSFSIKGEVEQCEAHGHLSILEQKEKSGFSISL